MIENFFTGFVNFWESLTTWLTNNIDDVLAVVLIVVIAKIVSVVIKKSISKLLIHTIREDMFPSKSDRDKRVSTLTSITNAIISFIIWSVAVVMILQRIGINTAPILASAGIVGVALGFGAQSLVKDFMTGMFIIAENQYRVGDYVEIGNVKGTVRAVTMRTTIVSDAEGSIFHIPNGSIIVTANHTMGNNRLVLDVSVASDTDIDKLKKVIDSVGKKLAVSKEWGHLIQDPIHFVRIKDLNGASIVVRIRGKVRDGKQTEVKSAYYAAVQKEFTKNKIELK